jgi:hypothetical protein
VYYVDKQNSVLFLVSFAVTAVLLMTCIVHIEYAIPMNRFIELMTDHLDTRASGFGIAAGAGLDRTTIF